MTRGPYRDVAGRPKRSIHRPVDWDELYSGPEQPWDIGGPAPPLVAALSRGEIGTGGRALVPGCGFGHDVRLLASHGFDAVGIDFSRQAVRGARDRARAVGMEGVRFETRDLFRLPAAWSGTFDLIFEQTCFCAIPPERRDDYVATTGRLLRPGGLLIGLFFNIAPDEGPPFGTTPAEIEHRFTADGPFRLEAARVPAESVAPRQGREWLAFLRRA